MQEPPNFGYLLVDVSRLYLRGFAREAGTLGFTLPESKALGYLARNQGISQAGLAELCDIEPMTLGRILDRMEADGWIERRTALRDRRVRCLYLKAPAQSILDELGQIGAALREAATTGVAASDLEGFIRVLSHMYEQLSAADAASAARAQAPPRPELSS
jgi:DNA-binding MarR family transcriptional regulator